MHVPLSWLPPGTIFYPSSDGKPMADNTRQFRWIVAIYNNLAAWFSNRADVFVSGNQVWYPVEGDPTVCAAPDIYVVFGRPKGDRESYRQWEEDGVPMTVVFEILSPKNTAQEMADKLAFYDEYGAEEYYIYDPEKNALTAYRRRGAAFPRVRKVDGLVSPRLGIRFEMTQPQLTIRLPDGTTFRSIEQIETDQQHLRQRADQTEQRIRRLATLSRKARLGQATPEELQELEQLEDESTQPPP
jgi:Uma2 family endonuclease